MSSLQDVIANVPIFSFLGKEEIEAVAPLFVESSNQKGEFICREDEQGDTFHIVLDGELEVFVGRDDTTRVVGILKKGDFFGEMALLQGGKRTASVVVTRRARILTLDRASFNGLFLKNPKALEYFTRVFCKRIADANKGAVVRDSSMSISISAVRADMRGKTLLAKSLAAVLNDLTGSPVLVTRFIPDSPDAPEVVPGRNPGDTLDRAVQGCVEGVSTLEVSAKSGQDPNYYVECAADLVSRFTDRFPIIIFDVNAEPRGLLDAIDLFSDVHIEIGDSAQVPSTDKSEKKTRCFRVVNRYNTSASPVNLSHCEPFVMPRDIWVNAENSTETIRNSPRSMLGLPVQRLARKILGATVGVALGGGAAFGIAHLGVLKVLERHNIPIDLIAGCSQGSIIGIGYAAGVSTERMIEIALQLGHWRNSLLPFDPTITRPGLLLGNRFVKLFEPYLSTVRTFADLLMPCMTVATNIESGERVPIGSGLLTTAFRASAAVPMVFAPVKIGDKVLVDGGVSDPVPAEVVNAMGADLCVAVNVVPPPKLGVENAISRAVRLMNRVNPISYLNGEAGMPPMFDIIMNSMQVLQHELGNFKAISADVLIKPDLSDFTWIEYYRSAELIQRGEEAAERAIPSIRRALDQKLAVSKHRPVVAKEVTA